MIVGTAGHIDHGKTTLVRALTGVDTDRLPEEKARGISIELGYAYAPLANGEVLGFVDVPGHEKFVHTMLAGATGIDFALLVVAADDGVMPQTREHLNILNLLGIDAGAIALTKIDAVEATRVADVEHELRTLVANSPLADAPIFAVSGRSGAGIDALRSFLDQRAQEHRIGADDDRHFRLAVDRSFTLPGVGTVVTGTVHSGEVEVGANVVVAPAGREVRLRGIHAQNRTSERGSVGQRCALNLAGIARDEIVRGDWIVAPSIALATSRVDARLTLVADEAASLRSGAPVHVHLGAAHVHGGFVVLDAAPPTSERSRRNRSRKESSGAAGVAATDRRLARRPLHRARCFGLADDRRWTGARSVCAVTLPSDRGALGVSRGTRGHDAVGAPRRARRALAARRGPDALCAGRQRA